MLRSCDDEQHCLAPIACTLCCLLHALYGILSLRVLFNIIHVHLKILISVCVLCGYSTKIMIITTCMIHADSESVPFVIRK